MNSPTQMDQRIFECGLSVETVSVYLLCTGLADADTDLTLDTLRSMWNGDDQTLDQSLNALKEKNILSRVSDDPVCYQIEPSERWA